MHPTPRFNQVAVIGGGMAGLLAARVLSDHAREVVLIERDCIGTQPDVPRTGVPQGHHAHAILTSGQRAIEALCPGITLRLLARGAQFGGGTFFTANGYLHTPDEDASLFASRALLEGEVRRLVLECPRIRLLQGYHAELPQLEYTRVIGVRALPLDGGTPVEIATDVLVDATGRSSRIPAWLTASGYEAPAIERVEVGMRYASRHFRRAPDDLDGRKFFSVSPSPVQRRACGLLAQEGDRWIATLIGYFGDQPPLDDDGFLAFARSLPAPEVAALLARAQPLDEIRGYGFAANQRVRYERLQRFPSGLLLIGDALASFSPVYGQGMSVAALQAQALQGALVQRDDRLEQRFFRAAAKVIDLPWNITAGNEMQMAPGGPHGSLGQRLRHRWVQRVLRTAQHDVHVARAFLNVARLLQPGSTLLRPGIVVRVLWSSAQRMLSAFKMKRVATQELRRGVTPHISTHPD
jgi:2-polyprenyl-6-methoxyphenol hydroxylase-like FAD-dependent oxidoreductase